MGYFVYVVRSLTSGKIYIGQTNNIEERLLRHNRVLPSKTRSYTYKNQGPWELVYNEELKTRNEALKREKELKSFKGREFIKKKLGL
jgi:putative endonuclease